VHGRAGNQAAAFFAFLLSHAFFRQTLEMKSDIEVRRSRNEHGTLTWQLGEIWPTGGWGSLE
jgi:hypothetical protein